MSRYYPSEDCDLYVERLSDNYHSTEIDPKLHILRRNQFKNKVCWFRDQDHEDVNRSVICSWGIDGNFFNNSGFTNDKFINTRIRKNSKLPVAGRRGLWKITRVGPCGMQNLPAHAWKINNWLQQSSIREKSITPVEKNSKSSSRASHLNVTAN